jgi:hypothetical protein
VNEDPGVPFGFTIPMNRRLNFSENIMINKYKRICSFQKFNTKKELLQLIYKFPGYPCIMTEVDATMPIDGTEVR